MRRPGRAAVLLVVVVAAGALALAAAALLGERGQAFTLGVPVNGPAAEVAPGRTACQTPITVPRDADFSAVTFSLGTYHRPGPPVEVVVRRSGGPVLARGRLAGGYPDIAGAPSHTVPVGRVSSDQVVDVCLRNLGDRKVAIYGAPPQAARTSEATLDGEPLPTDFALSFQAPEPRSVASLLPAMAARAALFRAQWVGAWTYFLLAALLLLAVPALLVRALTAAEAETEAAAR